MMKLRFDVTFHRSISLRVSKYLQETDATIARRIAMAPQDQPLAVPDEASLYEQALTMLVTEVLCNVSMALRMVIGPEGDGKLAGIVETALRKAVVARGEMDALRKGRAS